jgi:hypothetical protein
MLDSQPLLFESTETCEWRDLGELDCDYKHAMVSQFTTRDWRLMAASKNERKVFLWRIKPRTKPKEAALPVTLSEILGILETEFNNKRARAFVSGAGQILGYENPLRDPKNQIYVADIKSDPNSKTVTFLFSRGDPTATNPAFLKADGATVRNVEPESDEALGYSAHLVVSLDETKKSHRACFEKMPSVSTSIVLSALDTIIARAVQGNDQYTYKKKIKISKGKKKAAEYKEETRPYFPSIDIERVPSENLLNDIENGVLSEIRLTKKFDFYSGPGADDRVTRQEQIVKISVSGGTVDQIKNFVSGVIDRAKSEKFETITFGLEKLPGDQTNHPTIPLDQSDAMEVLYVRAQRISEFGIELESCYSSVCDIIQKRMVEVLKKDTDSW